MQKFVINISLNLSKIDKSKIIEGKKGKYLPVTLFVDDKHDQYDNDITCIQSQTKEERASNTGRIYLGNGKSNRTNQNALVEDSPNEFKMPTEGEDDGLPF